MIVTLFAIAAALTALVAALIGLWHYLLAQYPPFEWSDEEHEVTTSDGWTIRLYRYKAKSEIPGEPVLLCHGAFANHHNFDIPHGESLADYLARSGYDAWLLDFRGDRSAVPPQGVLRCQATLDEYVMEDIPAAIRYILSETNKSALHAIGHSLGGMLLYAYDLEFGGNKLASLTTLGSPVGFSGRGHRRHKLLVWLVGNFPTICAPIQRMLCHMAARSHWSHTVFPINWDNAGPSIGPREMLHAPDLLPGPAADALDAWASGEPWVMRDGQLDVVQELPNLNAPLFAIYARRDVLTPPDQVQRFFHALPSPDEAMLMLEHASGTGVEFNHIDLVMGKTSARDVFAPIVEWLGQHPIDEEARRRFAYADIPSFGALESALENEIDSIDGYHGTDEILVDPETSMEANLAKQRERLFRCMEDIQTALHEVDTSASRGGQSEGERD